MNFGVKIAERYDYGVWRFIYLFNISFRLIVSYKSKRLKIEMSAYELHLNVRCALNIITFYFYRFIVKLIGITVE